MFSYYGSKSKIVDLYPKPLYDNIIEPFAGSARYSLKYFDRDVMLVDKYEVVVGIWKYLQSCSQSDILKLPNLKYGDRIVRENFQHPAIFPEKLAHDHIVSWSNECDLVYDPFMGSGTVAKMAQLSNRKWIGSEIYGEYVKIANDRLKPYLNRLF